MGRILRYLLVLAMPIALLTASTQTWAAPLHVRSDLRSPHGARRPSGSTVGAKADFNGDGNGDVAIGVPGEDVGAASNAGGVNVIYGSGSGLASANNQFWSQDSSGIKGVAETNDAFGTSVAAGDFNGDGFTDLAVGAPFDSVGSIANAGAVNVLYGSAAGLTSAGNQVWTQNTGGVHDSSEPGDGFGYALVARDVNGDGFADLAIGVPHESGKTGSDQGAVNVLFGTAAGLSSHGNLFFGGVHSGDEFGTSLAAGDFNGDGERDLAVGAPHATYLSQPEAGLVYWLPGTAKGLRQPRATEELYDQPGGHCGASLASGNFDNDPSGFADLADGCPNVSLSFHDEGQVDLHFGSGAGLGNAAGSLTLRNAQDGAEFGTAVAAADFGGDGTGGADDLAVGAPLFDDPSGQPDSGEIEVFEFGSTNDTQLFAQGTAGVIGTPEAGDLFGAALTTGNFDGDGFADLAIGVPGESIGTVLGAGGSNVLYGSNSGLSATGNQFWSQGSAGIVGTAEAEDFFGDALSGRAG